MDAIQKFISDCEKIKKRERAQNGGVYDARRSCQSMCEAFVSGNAVLKTLAQSFADYWFSTYIAPSTDSEEPTPAHLETFAALQALLSGETNAESPDLAPLSDSDWKELCDIVNGDADEIPLDVLNQLMTLFVDKQVLS